MTQLNIIALYSPGNINKADLIAGFVTRKNTLAYFLAELHYQTKTETSSRHHLIIGQRGMGKTTLLHRIAIAITEDQALSTAFIPLTFREEQYNIINLYIFWRNCTLSLLEWMQENGATNQATKLELALIEIETAYEQNRKEQASGVSIYRLFRLACAEIGKRPILFLDNVDLILETLKEHDWGLRDSLQQSGGPLVISAAAAYPKKLSDKKAAFFDFFRITTLERLDSEEVRAGLQSLAQRRGSLGLQVLDLLSSDLGRIIAVTEMTGGYPRIMALLYFLLESQAGLNAYADLENLLDGMTPLYKARIEEAAPQARAVLDAVALAWHPITANQVARESGLDVITVNTQLKRLENDGHIEKVAVYGSGRSGYQITERCFNIWYVMRHGNRRQKLMIKGLTLFLRDFYSASKQRNDLDQANIELTDNSVDKIKEPKIELVISSATECSTYLQEAIRALNEDELGSSWKAFENALTVGNTSLWSKCIIDLQQIINISITRGYADKYLEKMEAADYPIFYAPLYWAFLAKQKGEEILQNVSPEVRRTAQSIYHQLDIKKKPRRTPNAQ